MAIERPSAEREDRSSNASSSRLSVSQPTVVVGEHRARAEQDRKKHLLLGLGATRKLSKNTIAACDNEGASG